jgi:hypothetical protein
MVIMKLALRYLARFLATGLAGFGSSDLFGLEVWKAVLVGTIAGAIPMIHHALDTYAATGIIPEPETTP